MDRKREKIIFYKKRREENEKINRGIVVGR